MSDNTKKEDPKKTAAPAAGSGKDGGDEKIVPLDETELQIMRAYVRVIECI
jgi:hypothetical protein